jgi:hypothetical protein
MGIKYKVLMALAMIKTELNKKNGGLKSNETTIFK